VRLGKHFPVKVLAKDEPSLVLGLLGYAAGRQPWDLIPAIRDPEGKDAEDPQFLHTVDAGLTPLMYHAMRGCPERVPPAWRDPLLSADLTARVRFGNLCEAAVEVVDACQGVGVRPTLLKGISISHQHYPIPHLRPMGDLDILVPESELELVESSLLRTGLVRMPDQVRHAGSHHGIPLRHLQRRVWVEVHSALFPKSSELSNGALFSPAQIAAHSIASTFWGRPVFRLSDELQLAYIASSWIRDLSRNQIHASLVLPLLDAIYLLKASGKSLDWDRLLAGLDNNELAAASLYIMLAYLSRRGLAACASPVLSPIASRQRIIGAWDLKIIELLLDTYLVRGRPFTRFFNNWTALIVLNTLLARGSHLRKLFALPWNIVFPPSLPNRYSVRFHAERIARILRGNGRGRN
jgi:putative nucleotidyltransferase-like protein